MATISLKMSESEKAFLKAAADFEGVSLSELIRRTTIEAIEDKYDARAGQDAMEEYKAYLSQGGQLLDWEHSLKEIGVK